MRRTLGLALGLTLAVGLFVLAQDPKQSPAEELKKLQKEVADAQNKAFDFARKAQDTEDKAEKKKLQDEFNAAYREFLKFQSEAQAKAVGIVKADPKSETGLEAAIWALQVQVLTADVRKEVLGLVLEHHMTSPKLAGAVRLLSNDPDKLETIAAKNPHKPVQAAAVFAIAEFYKNKGEPYGRKAPDDADELIKKAEAGFERVLKDFADEKQGNRTYGEAAKAVLFEMRNLRVGKTVPDIEGEDVDGVKFKLSDYRGKVVMLDFWGHW